MTYEQFKFALAWKNWTMDEWCHPKYLRSLNKTMINPRSDIGFYMQRLEFN